MFEQLYVAYNDYGDFPVQIALLREQDYNLLKGMGRGIERLYATPIQLTTPQASDPTIHIIAVTEFDLLHIDHINQIKRDVLDWLMDHGHISIR